MLDARFPGVYSPSRYIRKAEMVKLLERRNASCLSIPLDIDQCVAGITVPDDWQWIGYENIYLPWFQHLIQSASELSLICPLQMNIIPRLNVQPTAQWQRDEGYDKPLYVDSLQLTLRQRAHILNCDRRMMAFPLYIQTFDSAERWIGAHRTMLSSHLNMIIIDKNMQTIERFEPHGQYSVAFGATNNQIDDVLRSSLSRLFPSYTYIPTLDFCPARGPQHVENVAKQHGFARTGFCVVFGLLYFHLRISYPNQSRQQIIAMMMQGNPLQTYDRVLKYAYVISQQSPKLPVYEYKDYPLERKRLDDVRNLADKVTPVLERIINTTRGIIDINRWNLSDINEPDLKGINISIIDDDGNEFTHDQIARIQAQLNYKNNGGILYVDDNLIIDVEFTDDMIYPQLTTDGLDEQTRIILGIYLAGMLHIPYKASREETITLI